MVTKKNLIVVALDTFCLTSILFMIIPSWSADYNPWADTSGPTPGVEDGKIDMRDIAYEISLFNTFGDTTKNATVKDGVFTWSVYISLDPNSQYSPSWFSTVGFRQVTVAWDVDMGISGQFYQVLNVTGQFFLMQSEQFDTNSAGHVGSRTYDVKGTDFGMYFNNYENSTAYLSLGLYMNSIPNLDTGASTNVNVTGLPSQKLDYEVIGGSYNITGGAWAFPTEYMYCGGYSKLGFAYFVTGDHSPGSYNITLWVNFIDWGLAGGVMSEERTNLGNLTFRHRSDGDSHWDIPEPVLVDIKQPYVMLRISADTDSPDPSNVWVVIQFYVYLRND